jgi:hypothetical protein
MEIFPRFSFVYKHYKICFLFSSYLCPNIIKRNLCCWTVNKFTCFFMNCNMNRFTYNNVFYIWAFYYFRLPPPLQQLVSISEVYCIHHLNYSHQWLQIVSNRALNLHTYNNCVWKVLNSFYMKYNYISLKCNTSNQRLAGQKYILSIITDIFAESRCVLVVLQV